MSAIYKFINKDKMDKNINIDNFENFLLRFIFKLFN